MSALGSLKRTAALASTGLELARSKRGKGLAKTLGALHGLPEKLAQLLALGQLTRADEHLSTFGGYEGLAPAHAQKLLEQAYGPLDDTFSHLELVGHAASLGQVHFARLHDGRAVALKLQYPGIADALKVDLAALGVLGKAMRRGYDLASYRQALAEMISRELDLSLEAKALEAFGVAARDDRRFIVPALHPQLSRLDPATGPVVLAMDWVEGLELEAVRRLSLPERESASRALLAWFFRSVLEWQLVHGDLHPGNLRFVSDGADVRLGVLDFGCSHALEPGVAAGLRLLLEATVHDDGASPERWAARFHAAGFSTEHLSPIAGSLGALARLLFAPLLTDGPFDTNRWDLSARLDGLLGEHRMAFRVAAPSALAFVVRAYVAVLQTLRLLDAPVAWRPLFERVARQSTQPLSSGPLHLQPTRAQASAPARVCRSTSLRITITRPSTRVDLTLPALAAEGLEGLVPPEVMPAIVARGVDVSALAQRACASEFAPQELFSLSEHERMVRVWLE